MRTSSKRIISNAAASTQQNFLRLSPESLSAHGPKDISISHSGLLLKAELQLQWRAEEIEASPVLITKGLLEFKLPFQEKMQFQIVGRDLLDSSKDIQLEKFRFDDGKKYFGEWTRVGTQISYQDHFKKFEFSFEKSGAPILSVGALLFCVLRMPMGRAEGVYVGANKLYALEFLKEKKDESSNRIQIYHAHYGEAFENKTLAANLFVDAGSGSLNGGEIYLPVIGKISF